MGGSESSTTEGEPRPGIEEQLWTALLDRAGFGPEDAKPLLDMARKRDLDIRRIMRGLDQIRNALQAKKRGQR